VWPVTPDHDGMTLRKKCSSIATQAHIHKLNVNYAQAFVRSLHVISI